MKKEKCGLEKSHIYWVYNENTIEVRTLGVQISMVSSSGGADGFIDEHLAEVYVSPLKAASISFSGMFSILSGFLLALMIKVK